MPRCSPVRPSRLNGSACCSNKRLTIQAGTSELLQSLRMRLFLRETSMPVRLCILRINAPRVLSSKVYGSGWKPAWSYLSIAHDLLDQLPVTDEGPIAAALLDV